jgi:CheY-like chemotaxis protein
MNIKTKACKILHIDDDADDQHLFKKAIRILNIDSEIIRAKDGAEGLKFLRLMKEENTLPCIIVLDINMPKVNGRDACIAIKKDEVLSGIPLIIFSTSSSKLDKLFFQGKNIEYMIKPTNFDQIVAAAHTMLQHCKCD